jgi:acetyl-CoA carboxylase carboxyltransferase component
MEGDSAVVALYSAELEKHKGAPMPEDLAAAIYSSGAAYVKLLDAGSADARGHCDAVIDPLDTRDVLNQALEACSTHDPHC